MFRCGGGVGGGGGCGRAISRVRLAQQSFTAQRLYSAADDVAQMAYNRRAKEEKAVSKAAIKARCTQPSGTSKKGNVNKKRKSLGMGEATTTTGATTTAAADDATREKYAFADPMLADSDSSSDSDSDNDNNDGRGRDRYNGCMSTDSDYDEYDENLRAGRDIVMLLGDDSDGGDGESESDSDSNGQMFYTQSQSQMLPSSSQAQSRSQQSQAHAQAQAHEVIELSFSANTPDTPKRDGSEDCLSSVHLTPSQSPSPPVLHWNGDGTQY